MRKGPLGCLLVVVGTAMGIGTAVSSAQDPEPAAQPTGPPDLVMAPITEVKVHPWYTRRGKKVRRRWGVRFTSIVENAGPGHFVLNAHRDRVGSPCPPDDNGVHRCEKGDMQADQLVMNADGTTTTFPKIAVVHFDQTHFHWHMKGANRYELRSANGKKLLATDRKTGFCFGDRIKPENAGPEYPGLGDGLATCLYGDRDPEKDGRRALSLVEGISAGYADDYRSFHNRAPLEGQQLELTKRKAGRYQLINRTNPLGKYREVTKANNASSLLFKLSWPKGRKAKPKIKIVRRCPGKLRCPRVKPAPTP